MSGSGSLLEVADLNVAFPSEGGLFHAVRGVSFSLGRERLGIVGESGSGKSTTGRAILGLIPKPGQVRARTLRLGHRNLADMNETAWGKIRGRHISMVMQDPKYSLNPVMKVGVQVQEAYRLHHRTTRKDAQKRAIAMLDAVKIRDPDLVYHLYPHQISGGMGQRAMIAMMLICEPELLIADEPTSALDVTVQNDVLRIMDDLVRERGMGLIFISHNLTVVSSFCDRVLVMYGGRVVEECIATELHQAKHPYTRALLQAAPSLSEPKLELTTVTRDPSWLD
ncbi:ABC transporter ATP-binding protein [Methylovirgula sp. 4M-Z18]|uniref:ABC transporter ATP-binding protein n=1 Tax=Methylovirgula sp. 4M-Z18 TaxID=2293567 RepID=UPI000E2F8F61|nr:ABC transporter ATP-binding protein [Methylovirgula sp. 4M-Z18]RFB78914.1 ABC transporter ATP-binding protein [Methylovirgula sp. 4M-Z18]